jgi:hypothetical protein
MKKIDKELEVMEHNEARTRVKNIRKIRREKTIINIVDKMKLNLENKQ